MANNAISTTQSTLFDHEEDESETIIDPDEVPSRYNGKSLPNPGPDYPEYLPSDDKRVNTEIDVDSLELDCDTLAGSHRLMLHWLNRPDFGRDRNCSQRMGWWEDSARGIATVFTDDLKLWTNYTIDGGRLSYCPPSARNRSAPRQWVHKPIHHTLSEEAACLLRQPWMRYIAADLRVLGLVQYDHSTISDEGVVRLELTQTGLEVARHITSNLLTGESPLCERQWQQRLDDRMRIRTRAKPARIAGWNPDSHFGCSPAFRVLMGRCLRNTPLGISWAYSSVRPSDFRLYRRNPGAYTTELSEDAHLKSWLMEGRVANIPKHLVPDLVTGIEASNSESKSDQ